MLAHSIKLAWSGSQLKIQCDLRTHGGLGTAPVYCVQKMTHRALREDSFLPRRCGACLLSVSSHAWRVSWRWWSRTGTSRFKRTLGLVVSIQRHTSRRQTPAPWLVTDYR